MGLITDTGVLIWHERKRLPPDFSVIGYSEPVFLSAVTQSELLVGVHMSDTPERRAKRRAFVSNILALVPVLPFTGVTAEHHAKAEAALRSGGNRIGAHDLLIAATALEHGHGVVTMNFVEFERVPGLRVIRWPVP